MTNQDVVLTLQQNRGNPISVVVILQHQIHSDGKEGNMSFGDFFKAKRTALGLTLREFCEKNGFDPGNISKLERGLLPAPQAEDKLREYAKSLNIKLQSDDYIEFTDLASVSSRNFTPKRITDEDVLKKLPVLFRTIDNKELTEEKLDRIIKMIKDEAE